MELALSLRAYTPGVAMQLSLADEHIAEALSTLQLGSKVETLSPDDIWRKGRPNPPCDTFVFLHGEIICDPPHLESSLERLHKYVLLSSFLYEYHNIHLHYFSDTCWCTLFFAEIARSWRR